MGAIDIQNAQILYHGKDEPVTERKELKAGPLSLLYEAGDLRYIRLGDHEIIRRIYVAVRDHNWLTIPVRLHNLKLESEDDSFRISFEAEHRQRDIDFYWQGTVSGDAQGTISYRMEGEARSTFLRNRIGICVLHPIQECSGQKCLVEKVSGELESSRFPKVISPHQPFMDMRAISYKVFPDVWAELRFKGDTFEMEDQRNWTDASFKTYSTPLALPFPVEVKAGTVIKQAVELRLKGDLPKEESLSAKNIRLTVNLDQTKSIPHLGLGAASHGEALSERELERLRALKLSHLRLDLHLSQAYKANFRQRVDEAKTLCLPLELALFLSNEAERELKELVSLLEEFKPAIYSVFVFHEQEMVTSSRWLELARDLLTSYTPAMKVGGGTNAYFTNLNRQRPPVEALDVVTYSINPQVHAFDNTSLVETLEGQAATVASARQLIADKPLSISPVTLKPRFLPTATAPEDEPSLDELPRQVDERQMSLFGASWTLGSIKALVQSGVFSITYYETTGWLGIMERESGSPLPQRFRSLAGCVFPMYHVFASVGDFAGGEIIVSQSSHPLLVEGIALHKDGRQRILLCNLTAETQRVTFQNVKGSARVQFLDKTNALMAMCSPEAFRAQQGDMLHTPELTLLPYAIARIDWEA